MHWYGQVRALDPTRSFPSVDLDDDQLSIAGVCAAGEQCGDDQCAAAFDGVFHRLPGCEEPDRLLEVVMSLELEVTADGTGLIQRRIVVHSTIGGSIQRRQAIGDVRDG
jgi:hypothetical protein